MINNLHHFEILTNSSGKLLNYFMNGFKFNLVMTRETERYRQYLLDLNSMRFLITSLRSAGRDDGGGGKENEIGNVEKVDIRSAYESPIKTIETNDTSLFEMIRSKTNTVFNAAFQVKDLDRILFNCKKHNVPVLKNKHVIYDDYRSKNGQVQCAIIKSCVDGVVHSIFDVNDYKGRFLPGYESGYVGEKGVAIDERNSASPLTHFDHLTYATYKNQSTPIIDWYKNVFNMRRFKIEREENGLIVRTGRSGMNIKAINYWLCGETGLELSESSSKDFKFVISEPLDDRDEESVDFGKGNQKNQIAIFLDEHDGPGIQHIGLHSSNIVGSVQSSKTSCNSVNYYTTPDSYYNNVEKQDEIKSCGLDANLLKQNHILLDAEFSKTHNDSTKSDYLLQVFTQPIFDKNTLFLELIQRVGDSQGFGAANIKALWNAVQLDINKKSALAAATNS